MEPARRLTPEEKAERLRKMKNERNRKYYSQNKATISELRRERYDPEKAREVYEARQEEILERQRMLYNLRKQKGLEARWDAILEVSKERGISTDDLIGFVRKLNLPNHSFNILEESILLWNES
jgi:hypothetical protein